VFDDMTTQVKQNYSDQLTEFDLDVAYAMGESYQIFIAAPVLLSQSSAEDMNPRISVTRGAHTWRPGVKWTFYEEDETYWAAVMSMDFLNVADNPYTGDNAQPIFNAELSGTWKDGNLAKSINFGYRARKAGAIPASARMFPLHDQFTASAGLSGAFTRSARWVGEIITSYPLNKEPYKDAMDASSVDILFGMKHRWVKNLNFDWGATVEPGVKTQAPAWRVFTGLVYYWGPKPEKKTAPPEEVPLQKELSGIAAPNETVYQLEPAASDMKVTPEYAEIFEGSKVQIRAEGGNPPYNYRVVRGGGRINDMGLFRAPTKAGTTIIEVTDNGGQIRESTILIKSPPKADREIRLANLKFKFDSEELINSSERELENAVKTLRSLKLKRIIIAGHTDSVGNDNYNQELSERRAGTVREILLKRLRLPANAIDAIGYGEDRPLNDNDTPANRQRNRRVDLKVYFR
jgi:outer membrane protein OmpA-like peptidoglycan-associated protein